MSMANLHGAVYYVSPQGKINRLLDNMAFPNGIALSPDEKTLYIGETSLNAVWRVDLEELWVLTVRSARVMTYLNGGASPDGMALDAKGNVYVAYFEVGEVVVLTPQGKIIGSIKLLGVRDADHQRGLWRPGHEDTLHHRGRAERHLSGEDERPGAEAHWG
jgi:gluconolactonase